MLSEDGDAGRRGEDKAVIFATELGRGVPGVTVCVDIDDEVDAFEGAGEKERCEGSTEAVECSLRWESGA